MSPFPEDITSDPEDPDETEANLWFLPGPDLEEEDVPPGETRKNIQREQPLFDPELWRNAEAEQARALADVAALFGALDQRQRAVNRVLQGRNRLSRLILTQQ